MNLPPAPGNDMILRSFGWLLAAALLTGVGSAPARAGDALTAEQKKAMEQVVEEYLLNHPEVVLNALRGAKQWQEAEEQKQRRAAIGAQRGVLSNDPDSPVGGNPKGDVTLVEFFDYSCGYCKQIEPSLEALLKEDHKLRIVYKEFPVLSAASVVAARAAIAARAQGRYDEFHRAMMNARGTLTEEAIMRTASSVGLDLDRLKADMRKPEVDGIIRRNKELAETLDIQGTPAFVVGDNLVPGAAIDEVRRLIAEAHKGS
jgi:protein-disulfide isomerase